MTSGTVGGVRKVLLLEACDFHSFPAGGQLAFARQLIRAFGDRFALVGISTSRDVPVGRWSRILLDGRNMDFFSIGLRSPRAAKPLVPARIWAYCRFRRYREHILACGADTAFTQAPEALLAVREWGWRSLCYMFPGTENPLRISRYPWARPFASAFERPFFRAVCGADVVLAAADGVASSCVQRRARHYGSAVIVQPFPTRVDTEIFRPASAESARAELGIPGGPVVVCCGRISRTKGWDLIVAAFARFRRVHSSATLIFVGDGEDRRALMRELMASGVEGSVRITGFVPPGVVASYLNAADLVAVGSITEGWSLAMLEALACGKRLVSTKVSGAEAMVRPGVNGALAEQRSPEAFAEAMEAAWRLPDNPGASVEIAAPYAFDTLRSEFLRVWGEAAGLA
jgi:glycosyltransferase involved in cell wall biosynthesis